MTQTQVGLSLLGVFSGHMGPTEGEYACPSCHSNATRRCEDRYWEYQGARGFSRAYVRWGHVPGSGIAPGRAHDADLAELVGRTNVHIFLVPR